MLILLINDAHTPVCVRACMCVCVCVCERERERERERENLLLIKWVSKILLLMT